MFPFVPAGSLLALRPRDERPIAIGDIVCFPAADGEIVAHRTVARAPLTAENAHDPAWITRGDAAGTEEHIAESAIAWVVEHVEHRGVRYRTDGTLGRALARIAVERGRLYLACAKLARGALRIRRAVRFAGA